LSNRFHPMVTRVRETIREFGMIVPGENVLVAVSGGADSTALLFCLRQLSLEMNFTLTVAHLNHCIRGSEGDADAEFVRQLSFDLGIPCVSEAIDVRRQAAGENLEAFARRLRYDFLKRAAAQAGASKIAIGHHENDQAETVLFRLLRGSGIEGLSSIRPVLDGLIIRPLIACQKSLIHEYLREIGVGYKDDSTNADMSYARNRIRRELIPYLEAKFNPQLISTLAREAAIARETWDYIETQAAAAYEKLRTESEGVVSLSVIGLRDLHPALRKQVLRMALKECFGSLQGIYSRHIEDLLALCRTDARGREIHLPCGVRGIRQFDQLLLQKRCPDPVEDYAYTLKIPGECHVAEINARFRCALLQGKSKADAEDGVKAVLNAAILPEFLTIRSKQPGDRYGGAGHRKVKKMLIDHKVPFDRRALLPMIVAADTVIWIPGFRPARNYAAPPDAKTCLLIEMIRE